MPYDVNTYVIGHGTTNYKISRHMIKKLKIYIDKWWIAILGFIIISLFGLVTDEIGLKFIDYIFITLFLISFIGVIISIVFQFANKRWLIGIISMISFGISFVVLLGIYFFSGLFISEDSFANNLTIPDNIELYEVTPWKNNNPKSEFSYQDYILSTLTNSDFRPQVVSARLKSLNDLINTHQDIFLSTYPY
jgi:hypothetical protein